MSAGSLMRWSKRTCFLVYEKIVARRTICAMSDDTIDLGQKVLIFGASEGKRSGRRQCVYVWPQ